MGKRARAKRERSETPAAQTPAVEPRSRRTLWIAVGAVVAIVAIAGGVFALTRSSSSAAPYADQLAADASAPASLAAAADKVGFHQTTDPGSGVIESQAASAAKPAHSPILIGTGTPAPDFQLATPQGEKVSLEQLRGKAVLLEFFATWCGLCNTEAPHIRTLAESLSPKHFAVVSVNADAEDAPSVFAFHRFYKLPFPSLLDPSIRPGNFNRPGVPGPVSQAYGMKSLPTFYVIDRHGNVAWRSDGEQPDAKLREELERAAQS